MLWVNRAFASSFMPVRASDIAAQVDKLYGFLLISSFIACILVIGGLIYFALKYKRRTDNDQTAYISHNNVLEFTWSFIPFIIFMIVFGWGWYIYDQMRDMPEEAFEVHVVGQKWSWNFLYKSGRSTGELYVPLNEPVKLIMSSKDVIHSFFVPSFRVKQDVVPGMYTALWFKATKEGTFEIFCTEYCGTGHSSMLSKVHVLPREKFDEWLMNDPYRGLSVAEVGQNVFQAKCAVCHNANSAEKKVGPGFAGLWGSTRQFQQASSTEVDANYIRESILNPNKKIVEGYAPQMPSFQGQLAEKELTGLIEYIKSLK